MLGSVPKRFLVMLCGLAIVTPTGLMAQTLPSQELEALQFRHIGVVGNRVASVAGVVGNPLVYYAGAASGGLWKTEDGGICSPRSRSEKRVVGKRSGIWRVRPG